MDLIYLKIKTQKVQEFIFKVPKLKAMLGANSLLGEFFAEELPNLRKDFPTNPIWSDYVNKLEMKNYKWKNDDLKANFEKGVICSAGGHFETFFDDKDVAEKFYEEVLRKAKEKIPGVRLSYVLKKYKGFKEIKSYQKFEEIRDNQEIFKNISTTEPLIDNPYFYPSSEDGENPQLLKGYKEDTDSFITKEIKKRGDEFYDGKSEDYLVQFLRELAGEIPKEHFPKELEDYQNLSLIPNNNKMAIIAIDGNAMGDRFKIERQKHEQKPVFEAMVSFEEFWFNQRNTFRQALLKAIEKLNLSKKGYFPNNKIIYPFQIMMLGGDDLLIVSVPEIAFDLVMNFMDAIKNIDDELTVSAGIAVTKFKYPFAHAHELAESLLTSAKVKSRNWTTSKDDEQKYDVEYRNAIDWHIHFSSASVDIDDIRKQNYYLNYKDKNGKDIYEILTGKPYLQTEVKSVLEKSNEMYEEISDKVKTDNQSEENSAGRNKYKRLRTILKTGKANAKLYSDFLFEEDNPLIYDENLDVKKLHITDEAKIYISTILDSLELIDFWKDKRKLDISENNTPESEKKNETN